MPITYETRVIGEGNHASLRIPDEVLKQLGTNRRAPLKITINGHTYRSTSTGVAGECRVVFPQSDREQAGAAAGDLVAVTLELEVGHREVDIPSALRSALVNVGLLEAFESLTYSKRKGFSKQISDAKTEKTRVKRIQKVIDSL